jgi:hypothetical protein
VDVVFSTPFYKRPSLFSKPTIFVTVTFEVQILDRTPQIRLETIFFPTISPKQILSESQGELAQIA